MYTSGDGENYLEMARAFGMGDLALDPSGSVPYTGLRTHWPPGYPLALASVSKVTGLTLTQSAFVVNALALLALSIGVERLARSAWPKTRDAGWWPVVLTVLASAGAPTVFMSARVLPEVAFSAASVWFLIAVIQMSRARTLRALLPAIAIGLIATSLKWSGAFYVVGAAAVLAVADLGRRRLPTRPVALAAAVGFGAWAWTAWLRSFPRGRLSQHGATGVLSPGVSLVESVVAFGSSTLGLLQGRSGGTLGRGSFPLPSPIAGAAFAICAAVGVIVLGLFGQTTWRHVRPLLQRPSPAAIASLEHGVAAMGALVAYMVLNQVTRMRWGYFVLPRYWGVLPTLCWLFVGADLARRGCRSERVALAAAAWVMAISLAVTVYLLR